MTTFNPAFIDVSTMSTRDVQRLGHADEADYAPRAQAALAPQTRQVQDLRAASKLFALRGQTRNADTCLDLANKLDRFGSFVSDKQADYAKMLVNWATADASKNPPLPACAAPARAQLAPVAPAPAPAPVVRLTRLFDLMQRLSKLTIGKLQIVRQRDGVLCWVKLEGVEGVVGKIEHGVLSLFTAKLNHAGTSREAVIADLQTIEADPEAAAVLHGKATNRCAICSRELTDPVSIARSIGPICITKAGW